jgi:protein phosphatase
MRKRGHATETNPLVKPRFTFTAVLQAAAREDLLSAEGGAGPLSISVTWDPDNVSGMLALKMQAEVLSEVGVRKNNEDAAFASPRLVAVADGVGGAAAGEIASRLAIQKLISLDSRRLERPLERELSESVADANAAIEFATFYDPSHAGMGTTLTAVALSNDGNYLLANIGDSRTYLLRDGQLRRLTRDDSLVQELIDRGALSEKDARVHPQRSVVLEALDGVERPLPPLRKVGARIGDRLLLCSDGVTDYLSDAEIAGLLKTSDAAVAVRQIIDSALAHGSRDNLTVVIADLVISTQPRDGWLDILPTGHDQR